MKKYFFLLLSLFLFLNLQSQSNSIVDRNARFTVLTPHIIRLEYDSTSRFVNDPSFVVINRKVPEVHFTTKKENGWLVIKTDFLKLKYKSGSGAFTSKNLEITYKDNFSNPIVWHPGLQNNQNLKGTIRTLDGFNGDTHVNEQKPREIDPGLISKDGWYLLDDSNNFLFDNSDWSWVKERKNNEIDWYFLGYGFNYKTILNEFTTIAGKIPLPPRYAFGYWWSRYRNYADEELRDLVSKFKRYDIPLDVLVIDMDWHLTDGVSFFGKDKKDEFGQTVGWTGFTWNKSLFPDPNKFLSWVHDNHLKTTLNLHPASGIAPYEEKYNEFAKEMEFDTIDHKNIPFECADKKFMTTLFNVVLDPLTKEGIDFWWLDWQQWPDSKKIKGLSNTWWLNYTFFSHMQKTSLQRPLLYHRWGGLGNHRYQIGFSGDAVISWKTLGFQPYFTATASNVLYGYWSHDLGGHMFDPKLPENERKIDPEMYLRWLQQGTYSPIFRTHSSKDPRLNKEAWNFNGDYFEALTQTIQSRYQLAPYIYTMAREAYDTGVSICRPMYYDYPTKEEAYQYKNEYMFGNDMLVAPVIQPAEDQLAKVKVWLPEGNDWYECSSGTMLKGGQVVERYFLLNEFPVYVKSGAIIPMYDNKVKNLQNVTDEPILIRVYPGSDYAVRLYEDAGDDQNYQKNEFSFTPISSERNNNNGTSLSIKISPCQGKFPGMNLHRKLEFQIYGSVLPSKVTVDGEELNYNKTSNKHCWNYSGNDLTMHVFAEQDVNKELNVNILYDENQPNLNGLIGRMSRLKKAVSTLKNNYFDGAPIPAELSEQNQVGIRIEYSPENFKQIIDSFNEHYNSLYKCFDDIEIKDDVRTKCQHLLSDE